VRVDTARHPAMPRSETLDYIMLLKGRVRLLLDYGETDLQPFDVVIQKGTNHAWINLTDEPALLMGVLIDARGGAGRRRRMKPHQTRVIHSVAVHDAGTLACARELRPSLAQPRPGRPARRPWTARARVGLVRPPGPSVVHLSRYNLLAHVPVGRQLSRPWSSAARDDRDSCGSIKGEGDVRHEFVGCARHGTRNRAGAGRGHPTGGAEPCSSIRPSDDESG
jgi:hypothetical protein